MPQDALCDEAIQSTRLYEVADCSDGQGQEWRVVQAVSYTHLTLPTIYSV